MTETIRYALIGKQDLRIGTGKFEVTLADGRKALLDEVNLGDLISPLTANIDGDDFGISDLGFLSIGNARLGTTAPLDVGDTDTRTNTVKVAAAFWANTTGAPAAEIGTSIKLQAESADEDPSDAVELQGVLTTITAGAEASDLRVLLRSAGAALAEKFRLKGSGAAILGAAADPDAAALLELRSTTQGFLLPRVTTAQKNAIAAPPTGLVVYDTTTGKLNVYDGAAWDQLEPTPLTFLDELTGLAISNNGADATNDIDIAVGAAASDDTAIADRVLISLTAAMTKQLDAAWAAGTNAGGLDTGAIANTTYHVFVIRNPTTAVVDALFSTSATAPTMPSGYTQKRRIGSIIRTLGAILAFDQVGDEFYLDTALAEVANAVPVAAATTLSLTGVPIGVVVQGIFHIELSPASTTQNGILLSALTMTDVAPTLDTTAPLATIIAGSTTALGTLHAGAQARCWTNTSGQIRHRAVAASGNWSLVTLGWLDRRGRG